MISLFPCATCFESTIPHFPGLSPCYSYARCYRGDRRMGPPWICFLFCHFLWIFDYSKSLISPKQWNFHLPWRPHTTRCSWLAGFHQRFLSFTSSTSNSLTSYIIPRSSSFPPVDTWHNRSLCTTATLLRQPAKMSTMMAIFIRFIPFCLLHTDTTQSCHMVVIFKKS